MWQPDKHVHTQIELNNNEVAIATLRLYGSNSWNLVGQNSAGIGVSLIDRNDDSATAVLSCKLRNDIQV